MFLDEARLAAAIHHPNVVPTLDVQEGKRLFLVMEYIEGARLADLTSASSTEPPIPIAIALRIACDALRGVHAAHMQGDRQGAPLHIIHRDISPQNILVGVDGVTRVVDFGVARAEARATVTAEGAIKGKLSYMAPEQLQGERLSAQVDIFAMAVVMWEALAGQRLFQGETASDAAQKVLYLPIPSLRRRREDVSAKLEAVILKALARHPKERFSSAQAFVRALEACDAPIASHDEVGAFVRDHHGEALEARRAMLRDAAHPMVGDPLPLSLSTADASPSKAALATPSHPSERRIEPRPLSWVWAALIVGVSIAIGAAFGIWGFYRSTPEVRDEGSSVSPASTPPHAVEHFGAPTTERPASAAARDPESISSRAALQPTRSEDEVEAGPRQGRWIHLLRRHDLLQLLSPACAHVAHLPAPATEAPMRREPRNTPLAHSD